MWLVRIDIYEKETLTRKGKKMEKNEVIKNLMDLIKLANNADSHEALPWQKAKDAREFYGHLVNAIGSIGGADIYNNWVINGD